MPTYTDKQNLRQMEIEKENWKEKEKYLQKVNSENTQLKEDISQIRKQNQTLQSDAQSLK